MNKLSTAKRTQVIATLVEGAGINSACRITGVGKPTVLRLLENLGKACMEYQDRALRNLTCKRIQVDERGIDLCRPHRDYTKIRGFIWYSPNERKRNNGRRLYEHGAD